MPVTETLNSLGFAKPPAATRVVVAMSGGVDSSVTAALLAREGYDVVGMTLQLYDSGTASDSGTRKRACCAGQDIYDARRVAAEIGIAHYVLNYERRFAEEVMEPFARSYARGETPVPCVLCNQTVKFRDLLATARQLGAEALATGHYVRRRMGPGGPEMHRALDPQRDQSYFLFATTREQLDFLRFPLGGLEKSAVRALARDHAVDVADKPDSQDICFVPDGDYARTVKRLAGGANGAESPGEIVHVDGRKLGRHDGIVNFTVGQRRGLGVSSPDGAPLFVVRIEPEAARVVVGERRDLVGCEVRLRDVNWLGDGVPDGRRIGVKLRSAGEPLMGTLESDDDGLSVMLDTPAHAIAPGQACVFYDGTRVLGGGWIRRNDARRLAADLAARAAVDSR